MGEEVRFEVVDLAGSRGRGDAAVVDDGEPGGAAGHLAEVVTGDEHRAAECREVADEFPQPADACRVESVARLVEDEGARTAQQCTGETEALAHAIGVAAHAPSCRLGHPDDRQGLADGAAGRLTAQAHGCGAYAQGVAAAVVRVEAGVVEGDADSGCVAVLPVGGAVDVDGAGGGRASPSRQRRVEDFPEPLGPMRASTSPGSARRLTWSRIVRPPRR